MGTSLSQPSSTFVQLGDGKVAEAEQTVPVGQQEYQRDAHVDLLQDLNLLRQHAINIINTNTIRSSGLINFEHVSQPVRTHKQSAPICIIS